MKCQACGVELVRQGNAYVCPQCGATVADTPKAETGRNRVAGAIVLVLGVALGVLMLVMSKSHVLTIFGVEISFGMPLLAVVFFVFALIGLLGVLGKMNVIDLFTK